MQHTGYAAGSGEAIETGPEVLLFVLLCMSEV